MNHASAKPIVSRLPAAWTEFAAFLHAPRHGEPSGLRAPGAWRTIGAMWALDVAGLLVLLLLVSGWLKWTGLPGPDAFDKVPRQWLLPLVVIVAPVLEELLFRGWLSGRPRTVWLLGCVLAVALVATLPMEPASRGAVALLFLLAMPVGWALLRRWATPRWFARGFPAIFWITALLFGAVHLSNYPQPGLLALPLVLPQVWAGLVFGFVRMRVGLAGSMLVHAGANALAILPTVLAG
ncbi:CPBP family intramembrane glutamic endopeptidase [Novosphingobium sp. TH158]|uniref:CPBP family intramembrane glutamic endopeptidase n=1 Tax=Novosphingobium sp. TH158 TaxID=2067455 RepID=UPI000C7A3280|nr:CPBP family intramembrane glutamic endopeptidase [Novosphingobium sp. TH158]PLK27320.1 CPBP family intramembrane metalloprotease [Novosphingobium sp. TH158]